MTSRPELICESQPWFGNINVWLRQRDDNTLYVAAPPLFSRVEEGSQPTPTITLRSEQAQQWIDALWQAGLRPTEGSGSAGSLAATERHLADMRALVFKTGAPK